MPGQTAAPFPAQYYGPLTVMPGQTTDPCSSGSAQAANSEGNQARLKLIFKIVEDPAEVCNEVLAHFEKPKACAILHELEQHQPFIHGLVQQNDEMIKRLEAEMKCIEADLKGVKGSNRKLLNVFQTLQNEIIPFVREVAGYSISALVRCPFEQSNKNFEPWLLSRIKKCGEHGLLRDSGPGDLQSIFGIHHYSNLNDLSQDQMIMILSYLFKMVFHKGEKFQEYIFQCQEKGIIPSTFIPTTVYHGGRTNYSENCHRTLCAIYFDLLGVGMTGFSFDECRDPAHCPWSSIGADYVPSDQLRLRRDDDAVMEDEFAGAEHRRKRRR